jgi:hypothetical protein
VTGAPALTIALAGVVLLGGGLLVLLVTRRLINN